MRLRQLTVCLLAPVLGVGSIAQSASTHASERQPNTSRPSVILISIDTLRADHVGIYSYSHNHSTPNIDSFAEHGTVFTQVNSQIPLTLPSHTVLFTSTYPFQNHVEENAEIVPSNLLTLASVLKQNGYSTGAFIGSSLLDRRYGLDKGFDTYDSPFYSSGEPPVNGPYSARVRRDGALVIRSALNWLASKHRENIFAFVHLFDLHTPYAVRGFSGPRLLPNPAGYNAEIAYVDQILGHFKQALIQSGWWQRSVVILLSDHGESLGEHGETSHGYFIYESTLHVPVIVHWPSTDGAHPQEISEPAGLIDVAPTLLNHLNIPVPPAFSGSDLLRSADSTRPVYSETAYEHDAFHWAMLRGLRIRYLDYVDAPRPELYDLRTDPGERKNIVQTQRDKARAIKAQLTTMFLRYGNDRTSAASDTSSESQAALRSLGYLSGGARTGKSSEPDPKDRLLEYQAYERALAELYSDRPSAAAAEFRELLGKDASNTLARYYLGETYLKLGRPEDALREWNTAVEHDPRYEPAWLAIGDLYLVRKLPAKARDAFEKAAILSPSDYEAQFRLGLTEEQLGMVDDANRRLESACRIAHENANDCQASLSRLRQKLQQHREQ